MEITKTGRIISLHKGPKIKYPFRDIKPGETLTIKNPSMKEMQNVRSALYQFRRTNALHWVFKTELDGSDLLIHRIS